jgi:hypothetical protein
MLSRFKAYLARRKANREWKNEMDDTLKKTNLGELVLSGQKVFKIINEASTLISATTFSILEDRYKIEMDPYAAQVLASQVTNYLTGQSVEHAYQRADEPLKSAIGKIKEIVPDKALEIMKTDI